MQYLLMVYEGQSAMQSASEAQGREMMTAYGAYGEALRTAGAIVSRAFGAPGPSPYRAGGLAGHRAAL